MALTLVSFSKALNALVGGGNVTVTAPTGIATGNLLVAQISSGTNTFTLPTGWTSYQLIPAAGGAPQMVVAFKYATASEPASYVFTPSTTADAIGVGIFNVSGTNPTTPFNGLFFGSGTTAAETAGSATTTPSIPTVLGCLPLAFFSISQLNLSNAGNPTALTAGWTSQYLNVNQDASNYGNTTNANGYNAAYAVSGPITASTSTAVTASVTWGGSFSNFASNNIMLLINPLVAGNVIFTPSVISISAPGSTQVVTVAQSGSTSTITVSSSNTGIFTVSPLTVTAPSGTVTLTAVAAGSATLNATSPV
jgi:hypothetical protein